MRMEPNIGIDGDDRAKVSEALSQALADTYALYQKTHLYHWNVRGPRFSSLHAMFEEQYTELWTAMDVIAERVRALGALAPTFGDLAGRTTIPSDNDPGPSEDAMIKALTTANEAVVRTARKALETAEEHHDQATADLLTQRCAAGEKAAWMLRAHLTDV
jgi:starvation-inducible DNA-binding protein